MAVGVSRSFGPGCCRVRPGPTSEDDRARIVGLILIAGAALYIFKAAGSLGRTSAINDMYADTSTLPFVDVDLSKSVVLDDPLCNVGTGDFKLLLRSSSDLYLFQPMKSRSHEEHGGVGLCIISAKDAASIRWQVGLGHW